MIILQIQNDLKRKMRIRISIFLLGDSKKCLLSPNTVYSWEGEGATGPWSHIFLL